MRIKLIHGCFCSVMKLCADLASIIPGLDQLISGSTEKRRITVKNNMRKIETQNEMESLLIYDRITKLFEQPSLIIVIVEIL